MEQKTVIIKKQERPYFMKTSEIKEELGKDFEPFYNLHNTGNITNDCDLFFRERDGIINKLLEQGIIGTEKQKYKDVEFSYWFITDLERYKDFSRKLELLYELKSRRFVAEKKNMDSLIESKENIG